MDRFGLAATIVAIVFLSIIAGAGMMHFRVGADDYLRESFSILEAGKVVETTKTKRLGLNAMGAMPRRKSDYGVPPVPTDWDPGVRIYDVARAQPGLTAYASMKPRSPLRLMDMDGNTVHQWEIPDLNSVKDRLDGEKLPREVNPHPADFHIYPDGRVVMALANDLGFPPIGYAVVMVDKDSKLLWHYTKMAHHQLDVAPDGRIAVILNDEVQEKIPEIPHLGAPFREDQIAILSPDGEELDYISILDAILDSRWIGMLKHVSLNKQNEDKLHANSVRFLSKRQARAIPGAEEGDLLLSMRNIDMIAVLSVEKRKIVWAMNGPWLRQHDPHILRNGNVLLFDNHGLLTNPRRSRVLEVDPKTHEITWEWPGDIKIKMFTGVNGAVDPLANGNVLIAESSRGRLLEVARNGDVVWEYIVPERRMFRSGKDDEILGTKVWHPQRLDPASLPFLDAG